LEAPTPGRLGLLVTMYQHQGGRPILPDFKSETFFLSL
jgi:hypothetical protein